MEKVLASVKPKNRCVCPPGVRKPKEGTPIAIYICVALLVLWVLVQFVPALAA